jgi:hypothetical protein
MAFWLFFTVANLPTVVGLGRNMVLAFRWAAQVADV